jgi:hypothetical protein
VVLLSQCATKMYTEGGATLTPAVNAAVWDRGIATRVVLFRDWVWKTNEPTSIFLAGIQKLNGKLSAVSVDHVSAFHIDRVRLEIGHFFVGSHETWLANDRASIRVDCPPCLSSQAR